MLYIITADNPRGLDYEHATRNSATVASVIARIASSGGTNLKLNGLSITPEQIDKAMKKYVIS